MWIFTRKSFYYQIAEFYYHDKFWVEEVAWRKSECNKLTKMSFKLRFYYILLMKTFPTRSFCCGIFYLIDLYILECRGVATRGARGLSCLHFKFRTKQGPTVSVSNIRNIAFNRCSEIIRTRNFTIFTMYATIFG